MKKESRYANFYRVAFLLIALLVITTPVSSQPTPKKVLFVGNSFIYFFNLPQMVSSMAKTQGQEIITRQSTVGGSNLEQHWKGEKGTKTRQLLEREKWDYVVFNNHSLSAIETPDNFHAYGKLFAELVKDKGAIPIFMSTWGYRSNPLLEKKVTSAYKELAEKTNAMILPAGQLMDRARTLRPDLTLYQDDKHPSANGTYLFALAFHKFFFGGSTAKIPHRLTTFDEDGELLYLCFLSPSDSKFLQMLVDDFELAVN